MATREPSKLDRATVYDSFTHICMICGAEVSVKDREPLPHRCRIDLDAGV